ncbi:protein PAM68, chloroplastic [Tripterygium wilfordii]|uniref:protein PAM68, chloroplastic n=1 Tax=Tripterygium wilfordii TaxID=458696 RepID=UPI0018F81A41|nr:protein PAM68, chloroplastic [Tripterygium wilfordii]
MAVVAGIVKPSSSISLAWHFRIYRPPSFSKTECSHEQLYVDQKSWTFSTSSCMENLRDAGFCKCKQKTKIMKPCLCFAPNYPANFHQSQTPLAHMMPLYASLKGPRGFGPPPKKSKKGKKSRTSSNDDDDDDDDDNDDDDNDNDYNEMEERDRGVIPEIVTNRMISRMGFSVGIPLFIGLLFFPLFYYLKAILKIDIPTWVPLLVSFFFFGTALMGVSYGIVSSSWDPMREGSLLGWNEAQKNWPVFWQSFWGRSDKK